MDKANSSAVIEALSDAPIIIWFVARAELCRWTPTQLSLVSLETDSVEVLVGQARFAPFSKTTSGARQAVIAAAGGSAQTSTTQDEHCIYHTFYRPYRDASSDRTGVLAVTSILPKALQSAPTRSIEPAAATGALSHQELLERIEHAPVAISFMRKQADDLLVVFANRAYEKLANRGSLVGGRVSQLFGPDFARQPEIAESINAVTRHGARGRATRGQSIRHSPTDNEQFFDFIYEPTFDADGKPSGMSTFAYDVTAQVVARRRAEANERQLRTLADSMPHIVWTTDERGIVQYYNERWYSYTGFDHSCIDTEAWIGLVHPDDRQAAVDAWQAAVATTSPFTHELRLFDRQTRTYRWFLYHALPAHDTQGRVVQWFGSAVDVDVQKRNADQIDSIIETMNDVFFAVDANWIITRVNAKHERVSRMTRDQQIGKNFLELYFPTVESRKSKYCQKYNEAMTQRISVSFDDYYEPLNLWTDVHVYPALDGGLAVFFRDTSAERRLTQKVIEEKNKFEAVFVDSPACMALLRGPTFIFEKVNPKYSELMGYRVMVDKELEVALPELIGQPFKALMQQVLETGTPYIANEMLVRIVRKVGQDLEDCFFDFTYSRVEDAMGRPYGIYIHATDITEKVLVRHKTEQLAARLTSAVAARDEFLSIASHELKTPVTSLKMQLQMTRRAVKPELDKAPLPLKLAKTLDLCCRQVDRLTALIEDLLDVSRFESGKMSFNFEQIELSALLDEVVERFAEQFKTAGCIVETCYTKMIWVHCDGFRIEQVVTNLLSNAIKYGAGTRVRIEASLTSDSCAQITVRDEGMGIAKDKQVKVFDRFERAISHNNVSGLGLGLYISKQIVEAHHGHIFVVSELGHGSTFTVELPQHAPVAQPVTARQAD